MKTLAITLFAISNPVMVWSAIALFIVAALVLRIVDSISVVKGIEKDLAARKRLRFASKVEAEDQDMKQRA